MYKSLQWRRYWQTGIPHRTEKYKYMPFRTNQDINKHVHP